MLHTEKKIILSVIGFLDQKKDISAQYVSGKKITINANSFQLFLSGSKMVRNKETDAGMKEYLRYQKEKMDLLRDNSFLETV